MDRNTLVATITVAFFTALPTIIAAVASVIEARRAHRIADQALCQGRVNKEKSLHLEARIDNGLAQKAGNGL